MTGLGNNMVDTPLHPKTIEQAAKVIDPVFLNTPQFELDALSEVLDMRLIVKVETLNPIRSFKGARLRTTSLTSMSTYQPSSALRRATLGRAWHTPVGSVVFL